MPSGQNLSKEQLEKMALIGIGVAVFVYVLLQFAMVPSFGKLGELGKDIGKLKEDLKKSQALIAGKPQLENKLAVLQKKLKDYEAALPPHSEMPNILQEIADIASDSKIKLIKLEPLKSEKPPAEAAKPEKKTQAGKQAKREPAKVVLPIYAEMPIQIVAKGGYQAVGEFINKIESAKNIMAVTDVEIEGDAGDMFNHNARLLVIAYMLREEAPAK